MHSSAMATGRAFFTEYGWPGCSVLEVGSFNVNGSLREVQPPLASYWGVDIAPGLDVDQVLEDAHKLPFDDCSFDLVVSSSALEHDPMFWLTFQEMARVAKGFVYISAPVGGPIHNHPVDCWRFYPDAGIGLATWGRHCGFDVRLCESFLLPPSGDIWTDFVAVFAKGQAKGQGDITGYFPSATERRSEPQAASGPVTSEIDNGKPDQDDLGQ